MARIVLGVTGSVAAIRIPMLSQAILERGHELRIVATEPSLTFFSANELPHSSEHGGQILFRDADEWPPRPYQRGDAVLHIEFRKWADLLVVAPLDANTLAKFALGLSDNFLSCLFRAWDFQKPVILAPAMNTMMWDSPVTRRHFQLLLDDRSTSRAPSDWKLDEVETTFAKHAPKLIIIPPQSKRLACGDLGIGAMAEVESIVRGFPLDVDTVD